MPAKTPIRPEDIYSIRQPLQCRIAPGGERAVVVVAQADRKALKNLAHLWMVSADGARPFTNGQHSETNPRWSPDGTRVAFLSNRSGKSEIWTIPADGGEAAQLTHLEGNVSEFDWSPDGRRMVAVFAPPDAEAKAREEAKKRGDPGHEAPRVREVRRLFYKLDGAGFLPSVRGHLWRIDAETGRARQLTGDDKYDEQEPRFSKDGKSILFSSNRSEDPDLDGERVDLWRMPARGGAIEKIRTFDGPSANFSQSPDGRWIAFLGRPDPDAPWNQTHLKLWLVPSAGGRPVELSARLDRGCANSTISDTFGTGATPPPLWSPDSAWIHFLITNEGNTELWRVHVRDRRPEPVLQAQGAVIDYGIDFENGRIWSAFSTLENPGEIRRDPLPENGKAERNGKARAGAVSAGGAAGTTAATGAASAAVLTTFNTEWLSRREIALPEEIRFTGPDRNPLQGWVLNPRRSRARKRPAVLYIHGGPATQYGRVFFHEFQTLAAAGYTVFYCNPRGGTGYTERHLSAIVGRWGTKDFADLMAFTDLVLRKNRQIDRRRLAVAGGSYGGFMTNWMIGHTQRFACAITSRSISNFMSFVGSSDFGFAWPREFRAGTPWQDPQRYLRMSPLTYLNQMKTPTLIEHQEEDHRCPIEQAEQLWAALKAKGVPVEFARYPGEPHGMSRGGRPDRRVDRVERILSWLDRWLQNRPAGNGTRPQGKRGARAGTARPMERRPAR